jgi:hypothetical protein
MSNVQKIAITAAALGAIRPIHVIDPTAEGLSPELARILREHTPAGHHIEVGVVDWNMGADQLWGDDYAGDDYAGDDYAGDDYAGDDYAGDEAGVDFLGAVYRAMRQRGGRRPPPRRGGGAPQRRGPAPGRHGGAPPRAALGRVLEQPPGWRQPQAAPGVMQPYEGLVRLPFTASVPNGVYGPGSVNWAFTGKPQKPWRGERMVAIVTRSAGAAAIVPLLELNSVGIDPQQAGTGLSPLEAYAPNAFDVRECWAPAQPGIDVVIRGVFSAAVPAAESVTIALDVRGRWIA